jgi:hypothetical protein
MSFLSSHQFYIPVMGLSYTIDTPIKVAKYGIDSVISIVQDDVVEKSRKYYSLLHNRKYSPITRKEKDYRSKRITAYLNLVNELVNSSFEELQNDKHELEKFARMLPNSISVDTLQEHPKLMRKGSIDVNIMTKLDRQPSSRASSLTEACSALKGYAESNLDSSIVLSAGLNPRLFAYMQSFDDFYPNENGQLKKRIIIKVSDFRSALIQGKMLAKKGLWVSEYRIESGLNCGGHTFATEGILLGPILQKFKEERKTMLQEQLAVCQEVWSEKGLHMITNPEQRVTVQGGLGTSNERVLLEDLYGVDATGWASPFLLVPESTSIDDITLRELVDAGEEDIYNSNISPLGIRFNTLRNNTGALQKQSRVEAGKPGSACMHKHLALDQSNDEAGVCTASASYQKEKIQELDKQNLSQKDYEKAFLKIVEKECICDGLGASFLKKFSLASRINDKGVSICPGPNLAYFNRTYSLEEMVGHIYGKKSVLEVERPHVFINELNLYLTYFEQLNEKFQEDEMPKPKEEKRIRKFHINLLMGIDYYESLADLIPFSNPDEYDRYIDALASARTQLDSLTSIYSCHTNKRM